MSRHEAEIDRAAARGCLEAFRHPSQLPTIFRNIFTSTGAYYRAEDTVDLERGELIKLVSWTRKMAIKLTASSLLLGLIVILALLKTSHAEIQWTPDDFDWETLAAVPNNAALYLNLTANPQGTLPHHGALIEAGASDVLGNTLVFFLPFSLGFAWQALQVAVTLAGTATAIYGCVTSDNSAGQTASCIIGLAGTVLAIGQAYEGAKALGWFTRASTTWLDSGIELIDVAAFSKRHSKRDMQAIHEGLMSDILRRSFEDVEFLGYVGQGHRLNGRDADHHHDAAPIHRIRHPRHGLMDIASREHINGTRITITYANHGLEKRQSFQHEQMTQELMEARFDAGASMADPANPSFDAAGGYDGIEGQLNCFLNGQWQGEQVLSAQFYDNDAHATFGWASVGIFENSDAEGQLHDFTPIGMPLPTCG